MYFSDHIVLLLITNFAYQTLLWWTFEAILKPIDLKT